MAFIDTKTRSIIEILEDYTDRKELQALDMWIGKTLAKHIEQLVGSRQPVGYISRAEAARLLGVSTQTIDRLIADGVLEARKVGRRVTILRQSIDTIPSATAKQAQSEATLTTKNLKRSLRKRGGE